MAESTDMDASYEGAGAGLTSSWGKATARRIRRTRQRLGSYRHELLVAMRVVNSIEREMVQSEWENWLADETQRCDQLKGVLDEEQSKASKQQQQKQGQKQKVMAAESIDDERRSKLRAWHETYCGSCRMDQQAVSAGRDGEMGL